jgi:hypothetical protein
MAKKIEDRKKGGPILPSWNSIIRANKELSDGSFKPEIVPSIQTYDGTLVKYDKILEQEKKLSNLIQDIVTELTATIAVTSKFVDEREKLDKENKKDVDKARETLGKVKGELDSSVEAIAGAIDGYAEALDEYHTSHVSLNERVAAENLKLVEKIKKIRDEYNAGATTVISGKKSAEDEADKSDGQIRQTLREYQKIASKMQDAKRGVAIIESLKSFAASF